MSKPIGDSTPFTMKAGVGLGIMLVTVVLAWSDMRYAIRTLADDVAEMKQDMRSAEERKWTPVGDYMFMHEFTTMNNLQMPRHQGRGE